MQPGVEIFMSTKTIITNICDTYTHKYWKLGEVTSSIINFTDKIGQYRRLPRKSSGSAHDIFYNLNIREKNQEIPV